MNSFTYVVFDTFDQNRSVSTVRGPQIDSYQITSQINVSTFVSISLVVPTIWEVPNHRLLTTMVMGWTSVSPFPVTISSDLFGTFDLPSGDVSWRWVFGPVTVQTPLYLILTSVIYGVREREKGPVTRDLKVQVDTTREPTTLY